MTTDIDRAAQAGFLRHHAEVEHFGREVLAVVRGLEAADSVLVGR